MVSLLLLIDLNQVRTLMTLTVCHISALTLSTDVAAVAYDALPYLSMRPETTIFNAKRFIGGDLNDSATQSYATAHPYRVVPCALSKHSKVGFELSGYESSKTADASADSAVHKIVTPENVGTEVRHH